MASEKRESHTGCLVVGVASLEVGNAVGRVEVEDAVKVLVMGGTLVVGEALVAAVVGRAPVIVGIVDVAPPVVEKALEMDRSTIDVLVVDVALGVGGAPASVMTEAPMIDDVR